jgi:hypothetical protein
LDAGEYRLIWECRDSCPFGAPIHYSDIATVADTEIVFDRTTCLGCSLATAECVRAGDCLDCQGVTVPDWEQPTEAFSACADLEAPSATIAWEHPYNNVREEYEVRFHLNAPSAFSGVTLRKARPDTTAGR